MLQATNGIQLGNDPLGSRLANADLGSLASCTRTADYSQREHHFPIPRYPTPLAHPVALVLSVSGSGSIPWAIPVRAENVEPFDDDEQPSTNAR
jgi:hypothetical protein